MSIYQYIDYRVFLKDEFLKRQEKNSAFSMRGISAKIGFKSPNHFSLILSGNLNLSAKNVEKITSYFNMSSKEARFFYYLVLFNQALTIHEKKTHFDKMQTFKESAVCKLFTDKFEYFSKWYHAAVRESLAIVEYKGDNLALAGFIQPNITVDQIQKSVELLERLELISKNDEGVYKSIDTLISTGNIATSMHINIFQDQMLQLARESIDRFPKTERNSSTVTISINSNSYQKILTEIRACRKKILTLAETTAEPNQVFQVNFNLFPLTQQHKVSEK